MVEDDDDGPLFAWARESDPQTAHDAAASLSSEVLAGLRRFVCEALAEHPEGLTSTEIADMRGLPRDSISPRMKELKERRRVIDSGETRVPAGKMRKAIVWKLPPETGAPHG